MMIPVPICARCPVAKQYLSRGLCTNCYEKAVRNGTLPPLKRLPPLDLMALAREGRADDECWLWPGNISHYGYGRVRIEGILLPAHVWAYRTFVGEYDEGLEVDHLCHNADPTCFAVRECQHRRCVNYLQHLEPVTNLVNMRRRARS